MQFAQYRIRSKTVSRLVVGAAALYAIVNYNWVQAAGIAVLANPCPPALIEPAATRVQKYFGSRLSRPVIRCVDDSVGSDAVAYGNTNFAPGLPAIILLGAEGMNIDVAAHELSHAELAARVGVIHKVRFVPTWLDEGIAMQVDLRPDYRLAALQDYQSRKDLRRTSISDFSSGRFFVEGDQGKYHYALVRQVVADWQSNNDEWVQDLMDPALADMISSDAAVGF